MKLNMMTLIFSALILNSFLPNALAGREVGNGGGTVVCRDANQQIQTIELLDFYEARTLRTINVDLASIPGNWQQKAAGVIARIEAKSEFRFQLYSSWLATFEAESKVLSNIQFSTIPDSAYIGMPDGCSYAQAAIQRQPMFPGDARYFLNDTLWSLMDDTQKAGLVLHELIYREAIGYGQVTSVRSRYLTATYASADFATMQFSDYLKILVDAHFEITDFPVAAPYTGLITTAAKTARLSQPGPDQPADKIILLNDRILAKLGTCDADCSQFTPEVYGLDPSMFPAPDNQGSSSLPQMRLVLADDISQIILANDPGADPIFFNHVGSNLAFLTHSPNGPIGFSVEGPMSNPNEGSFDIFSKARASDSFYFPGHHSAANVQLEKRAGFAWEWKYFAGKGVTINSAAPNPATLKLIETSSNCDQTSAMFTHNILTHVYANHLSGSNCAGNNTLVGSVFKNGFGRVLLSTADLRTGIAYDPNNPYAFLNPAVDYYTWSTLGWTYEPGVLVCGNTTSVPDLAMPQACLHPTFDANGLVQSFTVINNPVQVWVGSFQFAHAAVGSQIQVEPVRGTVTSFVLRDAYTTPVNGVSTAIPAGATVTLKENAVVSFIP